MLLVPVEILRIIKSELYPVFFTGRRKLADNIAAEWRRVDNVIGVDLRMEESEAVVVLGGNDEILHTTVPCQLDNFVGVKINGVKNTCQLFVFLIRNSEIGGYPFGVIVAGLTLIFAAKEGIKPEMHHQSVARFFKKLHVIHNFSPFKKHGM